MTELLKFPKLVMTAECRCASAMHATIRVAFRLRYSMESSSILKFQGYMNAPHTIVVIMDGVLTWTFMYLALPRTHPHPSPLLFPRRPSYLSHPFLTLFSSTTDAARQRRTDFVKRKGKTNESSYNRQIHRKRINAFSGPRSRKKTKRREFHVVRGTAEFRGPSSASLPSTLEEFGEIGITSSSSQLYSPR
ncbi:hypothetical protein BC835DRAFT_1322262 [Cytidiella melzeri]|nr:hypothetical protein BC835DRAFT_1322262 [Cytidiella melzeri]